MSTKIGHFFGKHSDLKPSNFVFFWKSWKVLANSFCWQVCRNAAMHGNVVLNVALS